MLIDTHVHAFPDRLADSAVGKLAKAFGFHPFTDGTVSKTLARMDEWGVDYAMHLNIAVKPHSQKSVNDFAIETNANERFFSFGSVHPDAPDALAELDRLKAAGLHGIKLHPAYQDFAVDDPKTFPIYRRCGELGLPIVFHAGWDIAYPEAHLAEPEQFRVVLDKFPECTFVFAHLGGMTKLDEVERRMCGSENCYFDLAYVAHMIKPEDLKQFLQYHDNKRIFFATDCPWNSVPNTTALLDAAGITGELREDINWRNAARFLGITVQ